MYYLNNLSFERLADLSDLELNQLTSIAEKEIARFLQVEHFILNSSGLSSLQAALYSAKVEKGDEVICDAIFPYSVMAITNIGAIPVPVDIDDETLTMSPKSLEKALSFRTKAVIATAVFGIPPDTTRLKQVIAQQNRKIPLIEDHAQAFGVTINKISGASRPDLACYSFQSGKPLSCGFGGGVATSNREFDERVRRYISLGWFPRSDISGLVDFQSSWVDRDNGCQSLRLSPIAAGLLLSRMNNFEEQVLQRICSINRVLNILNSFEKIRLQKTCVGFNGHRWRIAAIAKSSNRAKLLIKQLKKNGSFAYLYEHPPVTEWPSFINSNFSKLPITRNILECLIALPVSNDVDANREIKALKAIHIN